MAKLNSLQKERFAINKEMMDSDFTPYAFAFNRETGVSAMAVFTGKMRKHYRVVVSYCGPNDSFKKKIAFNECVNKLIDNAQGVIMSAEGRTIEGMAIEERLHYFLECNFGYSWELETL